MSRPTREVNPAAFTLVRAVLDAAHDRVSYMRVGSSDTGTRLRILAVDPDAHRGPRVIEITVSVAAICGYRWHKKSESMVVPGKGTCPGTIVAHALERVLEYGPDRRIEARGL